MKIIIPVVDNNKEKESLAPGFLNSKFFCIYDCSRKSCEWISADEISDTAGDFTNGLKDRGISKVICSRIPTLAWHLLTKNGYKVYKAQGSDLDENISLFNQNSLKLIAIGAGRDPGCNGTCDSCSSV